ncbi:leucyl aminopeptidase [Paenibacillus soyae]|uniref:Probable cytosol aminopeptidase n=1 Tax=Paenibacillus soyae TaxID=2969249 RepID=A0A9X2MME5_9BACL|nr:leucyl aminopeptidase [Paenibacillus soyae]MCR2802398.1 leucyl aminopeptidase [Paenibacillus soyae]
METTFGWKPTNNGEAPEAIIRYITEDELKGTGAIVEPGIDEQLRRAFAKGLFTGKSGQTEVIPTLGLIKSPYVIFAGYASGRGAEGLRLAAAAAAKAARGVRAAHIELLLSPAAFGAELQGAGVEIVAQALTEGMLMALHDRKPQKRENKERFVLSEVSYRPVDSLLSSPDEQAAWERGTARGKVLAEAVAYARDLTNLPGNDLTPERLAFHAEELASEYDLEIEVIDEWTAAEQGMGGLLAVGQGSVNPPRMIVLHYKGAPSSPDVWGLIGKGITFDTGGISLKKGLGMEEMISDMAGAAAVLGALRAMAELKAEVNAVVVIPAAENMPGSRAFKPGDVIQTMSGYTVEIVNTDAEGRVVLADGITAAIRRGATKLIDVATLTGAVMIALGYEATGAVTNNDALMTDVLRASERAGERIWQLPAYPEFMKDLRSDAADLKNGGSRYAAASKAGMFIGHFTEGLPWVHLDIGGTAWLEANRGYEPKWATGVMVRTLIELTAGQ